ncbi:MAG: hypothetical protein ACE15F_15890 [bacterium]
MPDEPNPATVDYSRQAFFLEFVNPQILSVYLPFYYEEMAYAAVDHVFQVDWNLTDHSYKLLKPDTLPVGDHPLEINRESNSIRLNEHELSLEINPGAYPILAILSPDKTCIGGVLKQDGDFFTYADIPVLWSASTGRFIHNSTQSYSYGHASENQFSRDGRYFYSRGNRNHSFGKPLSSHEYRMILDVWMIDTQTREPIDASADVAFTSDLRYFLTERGKVPTLVDAETHQSIQRYDLGGLRMTAAVFSDDNQYLYIAGEDNNIYVFPSQLPSAVSDWENN